MALRLAGEQPSLVQGLDSQGWVEKVKGLLPQADDSYWLGSASLGFKGLYLPDLLLKQHDASTLVVKNAADNAERALRAAGLTSSAAINIVEALNGSFIKLTRSDQPTNISQIYLDGVGDLRLAPYGSTKTLISALKLASAADGDDKGLNNVGATSAHRDQGFNQITAPSNPAASKAKLYLVSDGLGGSDLVVKITSDDGQTTKTIVLADFSAA